MNNRRLKLKFIYFGLPGFLGFIFMYIFSFLRTFIYSVTNNTFQNEFVLFDNYISVLGNQFFRLALMNTFIFSVVGVIGLTMLSLFLAYGLSLLSKRFSFVKDLLVMPMLMPTTSIIYIWKEFFYGTAQNNFYQNSFLADVAVTLPIYLLFIWKNIGLNIIILSSAILVVSKETKEAAYLDGATEARIFKRITTPLITPSILFIVALSFVSALKTFRESYLFYQTNYPPDAAYTVQYYMNNHFEKLNYPILTTASVIFTLLILIILYCIFTLENKYNEKII